MQQLPGEERSYKSLDTVVEPEETTQYPTEFLNSLEPKGLPPHTLTLKTGYPVMLLRNIDPPKVCNGSRLIIKQMNIHVMEATILTGQAKGQVFLPRISLIPSDLSNQLQTAFHKDSSMLAVPWSVQHIISSFTVQRPEPRTLYTQLHFDKSKLLTTCKFIPVAC
jgi:hypothetical protein